MIQKNELRIGNWVFSPDVNQNVRVSITTFNSNIHDLKPIPLTEEILLKCGFEVNGKYYHSKYIKDLIKLIYDFDQRILYFKYKVEFSPMIQIPNNIEHLHELQNVVHSLTGQELKIEL